MKHMKSIFRNNIEGILFLLLVLSPTITMAQNASTIVDKHTIEQLTHKADSLKKVCHEMDSIKNLIGSASKYIKENQDAETAYNNREEYLKKIRSRKKELERTKKQVEDSITIMKKVLSELKEAEDNNTYLKDFEADFITPKREYIKQSYTKITDEEIDKMLDECKPHNNVKTVKSLISNIDKVKKSRKEYYDILKILDIKYIAINIREAKNRVRTQISSSLSSSQKQDWGKVMDLFDLYPEGIKEIKAIIEEDNKAFYDDRDLELDADLKINVEKCLSHPERKKRLETYIYPIPYLKKRYTEYEEWLKIDAMKRNAEIEKEFNVEQ